MSASASDRIPVEPAVLKWARESLGLSVELAASRLNVSVAILEKWEAGELAPTIRQLRKGVQRLQTSSRSPTARGATQGLRATPGLPSWVRGYLGTIP